MADSEDMWVFGYGSLIWKTNFPYKEKVVGQVRGFARRFWQGSKDHRGVPEKPGRVVTLVQDEKENVTGVSFRVDKSDKEQVLKYLDYREKGGYKMSEILFHPDDVSAEPYRVLVYMATEDNPDYLGPAPEHEIAEQIISSVGPSGPNLEYFTNLVKSLEELGPSHIDSHLKNIKKCIENKNMNYIVK